MLSVNSVRLYSQNNSLKSGKTQVFRGAFELDARATQDAALKALRGVQTNAAVRRFVNDTMPGRPELRGALIEGLSKLFTELPFTGTPLETSQEARQVLRDLKQGK